VGSSTIRFPGCVRVPTVLILPFGTPQKITLRYWYDIYFISFSAVHFWREPYGGNNPRRKPNTSKKATPLKSIAFFYTRCINFFVQIPVPINVA
jgi:hypothetical protein